MRIPEAECPIDTNHVGINYPGKSEEPNDNSGHKKTRENAGFIGREVCYLIPPPQAYYNMRVKLKRLKEEVASPFPLQYQPSNTSKLLILCSDFTVRRFV